VFVLVIAGWVVSLCLHEFGHAFTAWRFGDRSVPVRGYLDLDPRRYSNPWLSLGIPILITALGGIGLPGAAVYLRTSFMTSAQRTIVSLAGPSANLLLAVLLLALTNAFFDPTHPVFWAGVAFLGFLQITALLLNLLPLPGLDGYNALEPHLSPETQRALDQFKPYGIIFLVFLLFVPQVGQAFFGLVSWFFELSGVPAVVWQAGAALTRFWSAWF
jgi:Zn-dependent protease